MYIGKSCGVIHVSEKKYYYYYFYNYYHYYSYYYKVLLCFWGHNKPINSDKNQRKD